MIGIQDVRGVSGTKGESGWIKFVRGCRKEGKDMAACAQEWRELKDKEKLKGENK